MSCDTIEYKYIPPLKHKKCKGVVECGSAEPKKKKNWQRMRKSAQLIKCHVTPFTSLNFLFGMIF